MPELHPDQFHEQLPMFVSAREIHDNYFHGDSGGVLGANIGGEAHKLNALYDRKNAESQEDYRRGILKYNEGVKTPIDLSKVGDMPMIWNGHHRLASAYARNPDELLPVVHTSFPYEWDESAESSPHYGRVPAIKKEKQKAAGEFMKLMGKEGL